MSWKLILFAALAGTNHVRSHAPQWPFSGGPQYRFTPQRDQPVPATAARLDNILPEIRDILQTAGTAGISIGVLSHGKVLLDQHFGFADVENQLVANSNTRYPLASITKSFIAAAIAQLVDEGRLRWEEPLSTYVPELSFESQPWLASNLFLTDLLAHKTGLIRLDALWLGANGRVVIPKNFTIPVCNNLTSVYPFRTKWLYNNWMYALAGEIIERVTNQSLAEVLATRVFNSAGLSDTTLFPSEIPPDSTALPYMILADKTAVRVADTPLLDGELMASAGGIRSNVNDLLKWGDILLSTFRQDNDDPPRLKGLDMVLSGHSFINKKASTDELYAFGLAKVTTPSQFGKIGFNVGLVDKMPMLGHLGPRETMFYHSGGLTGYNHCFMLVPGHQAVIVVLTNSIAHGDAADWVAQTLLQAVLGVKKPVDLRPYAGEAAESWKGIHQNMAKELEKGRRTGTKEPSHAHLVGTYRHETGALHLQVSKSEEDGTLRFNIDGPTDQEHVLSHYHDDTFIFLPSSADDRLSRGLFHYGTAAWLLHFTRSNITGEVDRIVWHLDDQDPAGQIFVKETSQSLAGAGGPTDL